MADSLVESRVDVIRGGVFGLWLRLLLCCRGVWVSLLGDDGSSSLSKARFESGVPARFG
jgi:hypothetical protein